jgi:hypothetical protein
MLLWAKINIPNERSEKYQYICIYASFNLLKKPSPTQVKILCATVHQTGVCRTHNLPLISREEQRLQLNRVCDHMNNLEKRRRRFCLVKHSIISGISKVDTTTWTLDLVLLLISFSQFLNRVVIGRKWNMSAVVVRNPPKQYALNTYKTLGTSLKSFRSAFSKDLLALPTSYWLSRSIYFSVWSVLG